MTIGISTKTRLIPRPRNAYVPLIALFVAFGSLSYGYVSSVFGALLGVPSWYDYMGLDIQGSYTNAIIGTVNGVYSAGGALGCGFNIWSSEYYGRKRGLQIGSLIATIGAIISTASVNIPMFVVSRFIMLTYPIGELVTLVPLYQAEIAPADSRGFMVGMHGVLIGTAYCLSCFVTYGCSFAKYGQFQWRFPLGVQIAPTAILFFGSFALPYSPRWLMSQGQDDKAWDTLRRLHASKSDTHDTYAHAEFRQIREQINFERRHNVVGPWGQARLTFRTKSLMRRLGLGFLVQFGNMCTGSLVISNYSARIFATLGLKDHMPLLMLRLAVEDICVGDPCYTAPKHVIVDSMGLVIGIVGLIVCLAGEAAMTARFVETGSTNKVGLGFGVFFIFLFVLFYSGFCDATMYIIPSEIFPMVVRSFGISFSVMGQFLATVILLEVAPTAFSNIGYKFYIILIALSVVYWLLVYFYLPETKGKTLEDMGILFGDEINLSFEEAVLEEEAAEAADVEKEKGMARAETHENMIFTKDGKN
ncbi:hypothetical protein Z517_08389 [Fonsecaea pedrosoi CBS 271.37]|uniref:Unplaced genomic scaffold supercont1.5, whole genome shotgun sequence n=1 Tax=Fonsecaea pedrosoi CBS 271.37 TaxID=1442368 RepID=A0A0D2DLN1_9EURO|nr:uncharacterized protein Z517_08389 [Fonsecaea pedrosoi CBS 271.37]KIW78551.1 hypothetical protein Z517_08389 [Fonsecaea pedrosoi CBS 271.37]